MVVEPGDVISTQRSHRCLRTQNLTAQRMVGEQRLVEQVEDDVIGVVGRQVDLLEDHLPFGLNVGSS